MNHARNVVHQTAVEHGFWGSDGGGGALAPRSFGDLIALVHTEVSEAYTEWRHGHALDEIHYTYTAAQPGQQATARSLRGKTYVYVGHEEWTTEDPMDSSDWVELAPETAARLGYDCEPEGVPIELADIILRVLDIAGGKGIDIEGALRIKAAYNAHRPFLHGGKRT
jgi:hypothetical protein